MPQRILHATRDDWLKDRQMDITSTEAPALFGLSPYSTPFELFHVKQGAIDDGFAASERTQWGLVLQRAIAKQVAETYGVKVRALNSYYRHDLARMGASFDYEVVGITLGSEESLLQELYRQHGAGILEIKNVDSMVYRDQWTDEEAPPHIEVQTQHQLEVVDREWTAIGALVGGNSLKVLPRLRDREVGRALIHRVNEFWDRVARSDAPPVDWVADAAVISRLYGHAEPGKVEDRRDDTEIAELCAAYQRAAAVAKQADDDKQAAKAQLLTMIGDAEKVLTNGYTISAGTVAEAEITYTRKGYRNFRITARKEKTNV